MKKIYALLSVLVLACTGCFDSTEEFTIRSDGSGVYDLRFDMARMFEVMEGFKEAMGESGADSTAGAGMFGGKEVDTTLYLRDIPDTSKQVTPEERALVQDATMHMTMNEGKKQFAMDMHFPFKKPADLGRLMALTQRNGGMMGKMLKGMDGDAAAQEGMPDINSVFDFSFSDGVMERKVNPKRLAELKNNEQMGQMEQALEMFGGATMKTIIHLPRKPKKLEGANIKPGPDVNSVLVVSTLTDLLQNPENLSFRVEY